MLVACSNTTTSGVEETTTSPESPAETVSSLVSGTVNGTNANGTVTKIFSDSVSTKNSCPTLASGAACDNNTITLTYDDCSFNGSSATWNGSQIFTFPNGGCTTAPSTSFVTFTRTFGSNTSRTSTNDIVVNLNTATPSGYVVTKSGGISVISDGTDRTITINGVHLTAEKTFTTTLGVQKTVTVWDHTISSAPLSVIKDNANFLIQSGSSAVTVQHNLAEFSATCTVTDTLVFIPNCCHPTAGQWTCTLSGSTTGSETLTYGACGTATYTNNQNATTSITLQHCL
jgi:hypothetical protein